MSKKSYESKIGKIIYGTLLFMPLLSIGVRCLYVVCNKNAYQSYYGKTINEETKKYNQNTLTPNNDYYFTFNATDYTNNSSMQTISISNIQSDNISSLDNVVAFRINYTSGGGYQLRLYKSDNTSIYITPNVSNMPSFVFNVDTEQINTNYLSVIYTKEFNDYSYMDNVFEYSISQVEENSLYNWSKNTAIYQGVEQTTNLLGITHSFYPMLLTYWLLITIIYIIYDIALIMVLLAHKKVHSLIEKD